MGKIQIYGTIGSPPTRATLILSKAVGLECDFIFLAPHDKPEELRKLNPQKLIPVLVDDGFILPER